MFKPSGIISQEVFTGGINTQSDPFALEANESPTARNVAFGEDGSLEKRSGREKLNTTPIAIDGSGNGLFDYGLAPGVRKLIAACNGSTYKMDDLDGSWDSILSGRNDCLNFFDRISGYLINSTTNRETLKYWDGITASMTDLNASAPKAKYIMEFNGYMLAMNIVDNARRIYYEDTSTIFTGTWENYLTLPSSSDDEITWGIELRGRAYMSLKNLWYRLSYVAGETIFDYKLVSSSPGAIPRTAKVVAIPGVGEVILYLGWDKKLRIFDGTDAQVVSIKFEKSNKQSDIYLDNINQAQLVNCHAVLDTEQYLYRLFIPNGASTGCNVRLDINYKNMSCSPHTNQNYLSSRIAEDSNGKKWTVVSDYNGTTYFLDRGNIDEVPLNNIEIGADGGLTSIESYVSTMGGVVRNKVHDGGNNSAFAQDTSENFTTLGVAVGDLIRNKTDQCQGLVSTVGNGGGTNDRLTIAAGLTGGTDNDFDNDDLFNVYKAVFTADNHSMYIGSRAKFDTIVIDLQQVGSTTITPEIYYSSDAAGGYTQLTLAANDLVDGTVGFTKSGVITFTPPTAWAQSEYDDSANDIGDGFYYIKIKRTANALTTTPKLTKVNIGLRVDDEYWSPKMFGKRLGDVKKPQRLDFYFDPIGKYSLDFYDRIDFQTSWTEAPQRPLGVQMHNAQDSFLGTFVLNSSLLGSTRDIIKYSVDTQGINNCYQYRISSDSSYLPAWRLLKVDIAEGILGVGDSRPIRRV